MVSLVPGAATLIGKGIGALIPNKKDPERIATAEANLQKALNGDSAALAALQAQAAGSATEVGKEAARRALEAYNARQTSFVTPEVATPLQKQVATTINSIRDDLAQGVQNVGAGVTSAAANKLGTDQTRFTLPVSVPLTPVQMLLVAGAVVGLILFARHR
ncbi:MAG TPA: hypothetical protein VKA60_27580 [Blastocatellia bacterium]|nr:hypothetical protein [Blastocatellia bacterium]